MPDGRAAYKRKSRFVCGRCGDSVTTIDQRKAQHQAGGARLNPNCPDPPLVVKRIDYRDKGKNDEPA